MTDGKYKYIEFTPKKGVKESAEEKLEDKGELLGLYKRIGSKGTYYHIRFFKCEHECFIRSGKALECNNKICVSKKMSEKRRIVFGTEEHREKMRQISKEVNSRPEVKEKHQKFFSEYWKKEENRQAQAKKKKEYFLDADNRQAQSERTSNYFSCTDNRTKLSTKIKSIYADMEYKKKYLESRVECERKKANVDEVYFIGLLEKQKIDYIWQVPILTDYGKGFICDFFIPDVNLYVNIDGSVHGDNYEYTNYVVEKKKAVDKELDVYCENHGLNLCHISVKELHSTNFNIQEVINLWA